MKIYLIEWKKEQKSSLQSVLRIHFILMRIRIQIRIPVISLKFTDFLTKQNFNILAYFYVKTLWIIQKSGNFYNLSFFNTSYFGFESKKFFVAVFGWYFSPFVRIRVFLLIRIQEAKIVGIQWIRILSTA